MAIHEQNYVRYDGPLQEGGGWWIFARTTFRLAMSFKRTWAMLVLLWIPVLGTLGAIFLEYGLREKMGAAQQALAAGGGASGASAVTFVLQMQFFSAALLMMVIGCRAISEDLRYRTFQLYFSRPVERWQYLVGKFVGTFALCALVTIIPAILLGGIRAAYFARTDFASTVFEQTAAGIGISFGMAVVITSVVLGLSAMTRRTGYAVLAFIGVLFVPTVISIIVAIKSSTDGVSQLWNLGGNFWLISEILLADSPPEVPLFAPILILAGISALALYGVHWRVNQLEGIA